MIYSLESQKKTPWQPTRQNCIYRHFFLRGRMVAFLPSCSQEKKKKLKPRVDQRWLVCLPVCGSQHRPPHNSHSSLKIAGTVCYMVEALYNRVVVHLQLRERLRLGFPWYFIGASFIYPTLCECCNCSSSVCYKPLIGLLLFDWNERIGLIPKNGPQPCHFWLQFTGRWTMKKKAN